MSPVSLVALLILACCQGSSGQISPNAVPGTVAQVPPVFPQVVPVVAPVAPVVIVDDSCLKCICLASTDCKPLACHVAGASQYFCGAYLISWAYWADAGRPGDDTTNPYAFEACLTNGECAERTIRQYMAKHGKDCTGDNQITCADIARIHKAGPSGCQAPNWVDNTTFWKAFVTCAGV